VTTPLGGPRKFGISSLHLLQGCALPNARTIFPSGLKIRQVVTELAVPFIANMRCEDKSMPMENVIKTTLE
jgi:hypothetical protein